jgi:hypothetical protein
MTAGNAGTLWFAQHQGRADSPLQRTYTPELVIRESS